MISWFKEAEKTVFKNAFDSLLMRCQIPRYVASSLLKSAKGLENAVPLIGWLIINAYVLVSHGAANRRFHYFHWASLSSI